MKKKISSFFESDDGVTAVEYAIMLALIIIVVMTAVTTIGTTSRSVFTDTAQAFD